MSGWMLLGAYAAVVAPAFAIVAWGVLRRFGRLESRTAALGAVPTWSSLVSIPLAGAAVDRARASSACTVQRECYEHFFAVVAVPVGWLVAVVLVVWALTVGRTLNRHAS